MFKKKQTMTAIGAPQQHQQSAGDSGVAHRSCLAIPFKRHASSAEALQQYNSVMQQREPLPKIVSPRTSSTVKPDSTTRSRSWETATTPSTQPLSTPTTPVARSSSTPVQSASTISLLLTPPTPEDRANKRAYEQRQRRRGLYDGELEPEGTRGMQADDLPTNPSSTSPLTPMMRSFQQQRAAAAAATPVMTLLPSVADETYASLSRDEGSSSSSSSSLEHLRSDLLEEGTGAWQFSPTTGQAVQLPPLHKRSAVTSREPPASNANRLPPLAEQQDRLQAHRRHALEAHRQRQEALQASIYGRAGSPAPLDERPIGRQETQETTSDDDFQRMLPDLMPSQSPPFETEHRPEMVRDLLSPSPPRRPTSDPPEPSPAAVAAAEAAAAVDREIRPTLSAMTGDSQPSHPDRPTDNVHVLHALAMEHVHNGEYDMALQCFGRVLYLQTKLHGEIHPTVASAHHNLGTVHAKRASLLFPDSAQQRHCRAQALSCFQAAARTARDSLGRTHPNVAVSLVRIGFLLLQSRQYQNAIVTFKEALRIRLTHYGAQHGLVANLYNNLGVCHMHLGHFQEGRDYLEAALDIQRDICEQHQRPGKEQWVNRLELADTLFNIGGLCLEWIRRQGPDTRRAVDAEEAFAEALEVRKDEQDLGPARDRLSHLTQIRTRVLGPDDPMVLQVKALLDMARAVPRPKTPVHKRPRPPRPTKAQVDQMYRQSHTVVTPPRTPPKTESHSPSRVEPAVVARRRVFEHKASTASNPFDERLDDAAGRSEAYPRSRPFDEEFGGQYRGGNVGGQSDSIFREAVQSPARTEAFSTAVTEPISGSRKPPLAEVSLSKEEDDDAPERKETRIYMAPHLVPESPPPDRSYNSSQEAVHRSLESSFTPDVSMEVNTSSMSGPIPKSYSYDAEENCLISDNGVESEHGKIHYPLSWSKAGLEINRGVNSPSRDIVVTRPFRRQRSQSPNTSFELNRSGSTNSSERWGSETVNFATGNKERDELMNRARAILDAHESPDGPIDPRLSPIRGHRLMVNNRNAPIQPKFDQNLMEDGVAPLGGDWPRRYDLKVVTRKQMLADPMNHLHAIHDAAAQELTNDNVIDALDLFDTVLQCQRRRHGHLHPDVASALHNVGIAQLRAQNHNEALKAFEEAARIRKGALGREHAQVAESLVKVGITLLLLHRFEDALWSFREALSVRKHAMGALHPSTARIYNNIGCVHVEFNEFREGRRAFEAALDIQRNALAHDPDSGPLLFGTATTLCNLGYLYRNRDLHAKAIIVLKEALDLQERVLGRSHATVLSTLDNLADSCASSGQATEALRYYNMVLERFHAHGRIGSKRALRAEAVLLYKMSRVHRQRNDRPAQLDVLKLALRSIRAYSGSSDQTDTLERRIQYDIRSCREQIEKDELKWL